MTQDHNTQPTPNDAHPEDDELLRSLLFQTNVETVAADSAQEAEPNSRTIAPPPLASGHTNGHGGGSNAAPPDADADFADGDGMTLLDHLKELRSRLIRASIGVLLGMGVGLFLVLGPPNLMRFIIQAFAPIRPDGSAQVQAVQPTESFTSYMTVALTVGVILAMPLLVYQLLAFIVPGLTNKERRLLYIAIPFVTLFFLVGVSFGWFITVPAAMHFLVDFGDPTIIESQPTISSFIRIVMLLLVMNGVVFELPVIIYVLALLRLVTAKQLAGYRRYAAVIVTIVAAIITPTGDPVNLALLAIPMYLLFELGVLLARLVPARSQGVS